MVEDIKNYKKEFQKEYGWFLMAKEVAKFANADYFSIMKKPAIEILGLMIVMRAEIEINK